MKVLQERAGRTFGFTLIELMIGIAIIAILAAILIPNYVKSRAQSYLTACKSNVRNIGLACEMYATNNEGRYPSGLSSITVGSTGGYLKAIPTCPSAGSDTYTAWYTYATNPDAFTVRCGGANHLAVDVSAGYPMYDSTAGLVCYGDEVAMGGGSGGSGSGGSGSGGSGVADPQEIMNNLGGDDNGESGGGGGGSGSEGGFWQNDATLANYKEIQIGLLRLYNAAANFRFDPNLTAAENRDLWKRAEDAYAYALEEAETKFAQYGVSFDGEGTGKYKDENGEEQFILTQEEIDSVFN